MRLVFCNVGEKLWVDDADGLRSKCVWTRWSEWHAPSPRKPVRVSSVQVLYKDHSLVLSKADTLQYTKHHQMVVCRRYARLPQWQRSSHFSRGLFIPTTLHSPSSYKPVTDSELTVWNTGKVTLPELFAMTRNPTSSRTTRTRIPPAHPPPPPRAHRAPLLRLIIFKSRLCIVVLGSSCSPLY